VESARTWELLFKDALSLIDEIMEHGTKDLHWTFGGGTALMLRHQHRLSKDIDIFVPDPQALGYVNPRLSAKAEQICSRHEEGNNFVKLFLKSGEIDFVASSNLTSAPYVIESLLGRDVKIETSSEIIAKKFWHRGHNIAARDLYDFALVLEREELSLDQASVFITRHYDAIIKKIDHYSHTLEEQFNLINTISYHPSFNEVCDIVKEQLMKYKNQNTVHP